MFSLFGLYGTSLGTLGTTGSHQQIYDSVYDDGPDILQKKHSEVVFI